MTMMKIKHWWSAALDADTMGSWLLLHDAIPQKLSSTSILKYYIFVIASGLHRLERSRPIGSMPPRPEANGMACWPCIMSTVDEVMMLLKVEGYWRSTYGYIWIHMGTYMGTYGLGTYPTNYNFFVSLYLSLSVTLWASYTWKTNPWILRRNRYQLLCERWTLKIQPKPCTDVGIDFQYFFPIYRF